MVVHQIDIVGLSVLEAEDHAPIGAHADRPEPFQITFERVQSKTRQVQCLDRKGVIECEQDILQLIDVLRRHLASVSALIKPLQAAMI